MVVIAIDQLRTENQQLKTGFPESELPGQSGSQINRGFPYFANRGQRIARAFLGRNPFLFVADDVQQQLLVFRRRHIFLQVLLVGTVINRFTGLRMKFLSRPAPDVTVKLDVWSVKLWLSRF